MNQSKRHCSPMIRGNRSESNRGVSIARNTWLSMLVAAIS
jgi:hypothetical protein